MLKVRDLVVAYGGIEALKGISVDVPDGQIVTLIGANGAGKSTLLRTIMGLVKPRSGSVEYNEENIKDSMTEYNGNCKLISNLLESIFSNLNM